MEKLCIDRQILQHDNERIKSEKEDNGFNKIEIIVIALRCQISIYKRFYYSNIHFPVTHPFVNTHSPFW